MDPYPDGVGNKCERSIQMSRVWRPRIWSTTNIVEMAGPRSTLFYYSGHPAKVLKFKRKFLGSQNFPSITAGTGGSGGCVSTRPVSLVNFQRLISEPRPKKHRKSPIFPRFTVVLLYRASQANAHISMRSPPRGATLVTLGPMAPDARVLPKSGVKNPDGWTDGRTDGRHI